MTPLEAKLVLVRRLNGMVEVQAPPFASDMVAIVCAVRAPPKEAFVNGLARFETRFDRECWEAVKTLVEAHFARTNKPGDLDARP